jgi:hypothetical protein
MFAQLAEVTPPVTDRGIASQPGIAMPVTLSVKVTEPESCVLPAGIGVIVALKVTDWPTLDVGTDETKASELLA